MCISDESHPKLGPKLSRESDMGIRDLWFQFKESSTDSEISPKPLRFFESITFASADRRSISCSPPVQHRRIPMRPEGRRLPSTDSFLSAPGTASASVQLENHCHGCNDGRLVSSKHVLTKYGTALGNKVALGKNPSKLFREAQGIWRSQTRIYKKQQPRYAMMFVSWCSKVWSIPKEGIPKIPPKTT